MDLISEIKYRYYINNCNLTLRSRGLAPFLMMEGCCLSSSSSVTGNSSWGSTGFHFRVKMLHNQKTRVKILDLLWLRAGAATKAQFFGLCRKKLTNLEAFGVDTPRKWLHKTKRRKWYIEFKKYFLFRLILF